MQEFFLSPVTPVVPAAPVAARIRTFLRSRSNSVSSVVSTCSLAGDTMRKLVLNSPGPVTSTPGGVGEGPGLMGEERSEDGGYGTLDISGVRSLGDTSDAGQPDKDAANNTEPTTTLHTQPQLPPPQPKNKEKKYTVEGSKTVLTDKTWQAMHKLPAIELGKLRDLSARNAPLIPPK